MAANIAYVLTPTDVRNIRSYVHYKYAAMPQEKRAEIVADAVRRIIYKQLPDFNLSIKKELTHKLIQRTVLEQQRPVSADDIYLLCMELDQQREEAIAEPLRRWVREQEQRLNGNQAIAGAVRSASSSTAAAEAIPLPASASAGMIRKNKQKGLYLYSILSLFVAAASVLFGWSLIGDRSGTAMDVHSVQQPVPHAAVPSLPLNGLPSELRYKKVNRERLIAYLDSKSSLLAEADYLDAILHTANNFDIHPALMIAITGQEQGFVPKTHRKASEIANNPFNVFHSWKQFNTTIEQSSQIAARTIVRLSKDRPSHIDPFAWINREYAEDPNWSKGVRSIFSAIISELDKP